DPPAAVDARRQRIATPGDVALEPLDVGRHALEALRQRLDTLVAGWARRLDADRLADRLGELRRLRRLQADHRHAGLAPVARDMQPVGRVRIDDDAVALVHRANRRQTIGVRAAPGSEAVRGQACGFGTARDVELPV